MDRSAQKAPPAESPSSPVVPAPRAFEDLYGQHFEFVWRNLRRMGVPAALVEDAAQDAFVVVHRRLADLRPEASAKAWLFSIVMRVAHDYRRSQRRKPTMSHDMDTATSPARGPFEATAAAQAMRTLERFLGTLDDDKRMVFVLSELEEMSAPEMSEALGAGVNTIYSRLRIARERFVAFLGTEGGSHE